MFCFSNALKGNFLSRHDKPRAAAVKGWLLYKKFRFGVKMRFPFHFRTSSFKFWETQSPVSVGKPPPDWQKVQICVLIYLIKAPGSAGIIFKVLFFFLVYVKTKCKVSNTVVFFDCCRKKGCGGKKKKGCVVIIYCICVMDTKTKSKISLCSFNSSKYEIIQLRVQRVNFVTMETLSDNWPNYFPICEQLQTSLDSLSAMQETGMQKHHSHIFVTEYISVCI